MRLIDKLPFELDSRTKAYAYATLYNLFWVLTEFWNLSTKDVALRSDLLKQQYQNDLESYFLEELQHYRFLFRITLKITKREVNQAVQNLYKLLFDFSLVS